MPDAIQKDVPAGTPDLNAADAHYTRDEAMKAMLERRNAQARADGVQFEAAAGAPGTGTPDPDNPHGDAVDPNAPPSGELSAPISASDQLARQADEPTVLSDEDLARYAVRTKVNGVEETVPLTRLRADAQKTSAADQYLETAKKTLEEVRAAAAAAAAHKDSPPPPTQAEPGTTSPDDPIGAGIEALFQGDEARAKEAFRKALEGRGNATPSPSAEQIASQVETRMVINSALRQFAKDHKEIASDPFARQLADGFLAAELRDRSVTRLEELPSEQIPEVIDRAGKATKDYFRAKAGVAPAQLRAAPRDAVRQAKQQLDEPPAAGARATTTETPPPSASDVIESMRRARMPQQARPPG